MPKPLQPSPDRTRQRFNEKKIEIYRPYRKSAGYWLKSRFNEKKIEIRKRYLDGSDRIHKFQ